METSQATTRRGVTLLTLIALIVIVIITLTVVAPALRRWIDPAEAARHANALRLAEARDNALEPLRLLLAQVGLGAGVVILIALAGAALAGLVAVWRYLPTRAEATAGMVYPKNGMQPTLLQPESSRIRVYAPARNEKAEEFRAIFSGPELVGVDPPRVSSPTLRQLSAPDESVIDAKVDLLPADVLTPDLSQRPHRLIIGESGAGKTNTIYQAIEAFLSHYSNAEIIVCSLVRKDWNDLSASTPATIYAAMQAVTQEMQRRDELMTSRGLREFRDTGLPPVCFVVDEAEAIGDACNNRRERAEFKGALRNVIRMGRNFGVVGIFGTQLARRDMFDPTVIDNMGAVIIHRVSRTVAAQFQIWDPRVTAQILTLPTGRAYDLRREAFVSFPRVPQPQLRLSDLYHEPAGQYLLPADAEADGIGADDLPADSTNDITARSASDWSQPTGSVAPYALATEMYLYWKRNGENLRAVERHFNPDATPGGGFHYSAAATINAMLRQRGRPEKYKERGAQ